MMRVKQCFGRLVAVAVAAGSALAGCGGGGGNDDGGPTGAGAAAVALNSDNFVTATAVAIGTSASIFDPLEFVLGAQAGGLDRVLQVAVAKTRELPKRSRPAEILTGTTVSESEPCAQGGLVSGEVTYASETSTSVGDRVDLTFSSCREDGMVIDGRIAARIDSLSGDIDRSDQYRVVLSASADNLTVSDGGSTFVGNGDLGITVESFTSLRQNVTLRIPAFSVSGQIGGTPYARTLTEYTIVHRTAQNGDFEYEVDGRVTASELAGNYVDIDTQIPFFEAFADVTPTSGMALIHGAQGSRVRLTAWPNGTALIELDANGDGTYENSAIRTWDELTGG